jgi:hypothetical protein
MEFAYFCVKCVTTIFILKYIAETIQVIFSGYKAEETSLLKEYLRKKLIPKKSTWDKEETVTRWRRDRDED